MKLAGFWRASVVVVAVFAAVWLCVIAYWRIAGVAPGAAQLLLYLAVLPLGLLSALWLAMRLRRRAAESVGVDETAAPVPEAEAREQPLPPPVQVLAAGVRLACGEDAAQLLRRLPALPRPGLHPALRDRDGLPVLAAAADGLETDPLSDRLARHAGSGKVRFVDEHLRALAMLETVAEELFDAAARRLPPLPEAEERVIAGLRRRVESAAPQDRGGVRVCVLLPQDMPQALQQACGSWLRELARDSGLDPQRSVFEVASVRGQDEVWRRVERVMQADDAGRDWQLLLAAASSIGERGVHALIAGGRLIGAAHPEGLVPGEGAAGVLLRPATGAPATADDGPVVELAALGRGSAADGAPARTLARATGEMMGALLARAAAERDDVGMVLSDADQRPSRAIEATAAASSACPELDPVGQCPALGVGSGHLGHVAPLALLALAAAQALQTRTPVVALSVTDDRDRLAALVRPAAARNPNTQPHDAGQAPDLAA